MINGYGFLPIEFTSITNMELLKKEKLHIEIIEKLIQLGQIILIKIFSFS